jgi:DNA topoisomerase VI subunit A
VAVLTRVLQLIHGVLTRGIHVTKRDLFYTDVKLFKDQKDSDAVLDDISCMLGCTRNSLHVVASEKGVVVGRLQYRVRRMRARMCHVALVSGRRDVRCREDSPSPRLVGFWTFLG